ncbi:hypothetical protein [Leptolyngbya sp. 7M]|uniref:hypothetical protein n=1 Tax=Leptolyngbya sp. 7M TaxID=2812896 RepID=UPI001B8CC1E9|nr:hypothetical protein [Leptolyngbya sp. 7M]QYO67035.1 hypothetical protein JVX88_09610 [Leptolyngbya sp. 7M]
MSASEFLNHLPTENQSHISPLAPPQRYSNPAEAVRLSSDNLLRYSQGGIGNTSTTWMFYRIIAKQL